MSDDLPKLILDEATKVAERDIAALLPKPRHEPLLVGMPRATREYVEREQQAYITRLERRNQELETEVAELRPKTSNERIEELEAKLENCIEISPHNAKLIIQFVKKPVEGEDWEVDATVDLFWKELEKQAAKA